MARWRESSWWRDLLLTSLVLALFIAGLRLSVRQIAAPVPWCDLAIADDADRPPADDEFRPLPRQMLVAVPNHGIWLRITPDQPWSSEDRPVLVVSNSGWTELSLTLAGQTIGAVGNHDDQGVGHRDRLNALFLLPHRPEGRMLLHVQPIEARNLSLQLLESEVVHGEQLAATRLINFSVAVLAVMALLSGLFWISVRHSAFLAYAGMAASSALYMLMTSGEGFHWPLGRLLRLHHEMIVLVVGSGAVSSLIFIQLMLGTTTPGRRLRWPMRLSVAGWFIAFALAFVLAEPQQVILRQGANLLLAIGVLLNLGVMVPAAFDGSRSAGLMLLGGVIGWFSVITLLVEIVSGTMPGIDVLFPIAQVLGLTLPALALADVWAQDRAALTVARTAAETDALTRVLNRRAIEARLHGAFAQMRNVGGALSVIFVDLDHFKAINDSLGHDCGDLCLKLAALRMQGQLRPHDQLGRWGGEEFLIMLPGAEIDEAVRVAERIRAALAAEPLSVAPTRLAITASLGVAALTAADSSIDTVIKRADEALYQAKRGGRNRVVATQREAVPA